MAKVAKPVVDSLSAAVFVDRDGTLIKEVGYLSRLDQIEILPGVPEGLCRLRENGLKIVMVTNQSAVARGMLNEAQLQAIHREVWVRLSNAGAILDGIYYCPHHPEEGIGDYRRICECRKPKSGMVAKAARELRLDPQGSYVVGDQAIDMELAGSIQAKGVRIGQPPFPDAADLGYTMVKDFPEAAEWIARDFARYSTRNEGET